MAENTEYKIPLGKCIALAFIFTIILCVYSNILGALKYIEGWSGFLFYWVWTTFLGARKDLILKTVINSLVGIFVGGFLPYWTLYAYGLNAYYVVVMLVMLVILFFNISKMIPMVVGETTFLYMTVLGSHRYLLDKNVNYVQVAVSYAMGVVLFAVTTLLVYKLMFRAPKASKQA